MSRMKNRDTALRNDSPKMTSKAIMRTRRMGPLRHTSLAPSLRDTLALTSVSGSFTKVITRNAQTGSTPMTTQARPARTGPVSVARSTGSAFMISPVKALVASFHSAPSTTSTLPPRSAMTSMIIGTAAATIKPTKTNSSRAAVTRLRW